MGAETSRKPVRATAAGILLLALAACASTPNQPTSYTEPISTSSATASQPTGNPTPTDTAPTTSQSPEPTPGVTVTVTVTQDGAGCGAPANPWGFNLCGTGQLIYQADLPRTVCSYFRCIPYFPNGRGYMVECRDSMYSMSGGLQGACSHHRGKKQPVYRP